MKKLSTMGLTLALLVVLGGAAQADQTLVVDSGWTSFSWTSGPEVWNYDGAYTYSAASWTSLKVADGGIDGDQFEVYDNGILVGTTSVPTDTSTSFGWDYDANFSNPQMSSGEFFLAPGDHSITLYVIDTAYAYSSGNAGLRADTCSAPTVPAPAGILLGTLGTGLVGWLRRRKSL